MVFAASKKFRSRIERLGCNHQPRPDMRVFRPARLEGTQTIVFVGSEMTRTQDGPAGRAGARVRWPPRFTPPA
jgi:hypothetical protein